MYNLINRQAAIDILEVAINDGWEFNYAKNRMIELSTQPEIVRCKDCRFRGDNKNCYVSNFKGGLPCMIRWVKDNDYCSIGERKTDG